MLLKNECGAPLWPTVSDRQNIVRTSMRVPMYTRRTLILFLRL